MDENEMLCYAALAIVLQRETKKKRVWMKE